MTIKLLSQRFELIPDANLVLLRKPGPDDFVLKAEIKPEDLLQWAKRLQTLYTVEHIEMKQGHAADVSFSPVHHPGVLMTTDTDFARGKAAQIMEQLIQNNPVLHFAASSQQNVSALQLIEVLCRQVASLEEALAKNMQGFHGMLAVKGTTTGPCSSLTPNSTEKEPEIDTDKEPGPDTV